MASASEVQRNLIQRVNVGDSLTRTAARYPERVALVDLASPEGERRLTYRELNSLVNRFAQGLLALGSELPRTSTGKIQKNVLRDQYAHYYDGRL